MRPVAASPRTNQTRENMDNQMAVIDQKFGTHLLDLLAVDEERGSRIMLRQREFSKTYATKLKSRSLQTMAARKKVLDDEADKQRRKVLATAAELERLTQLAVIWRRDIQRQFVGVQTKTMAKPLDEQIEAAGSDGKRRALVVDYLKMMKLVHRLHGVKTLRSIFFSKADKEAIMTQDGVKVSTGQLIVRLNKCAAYLAERGEEEVLELA